MPKVSVIMGIYNIGKEDVLKRAIDSILNQTFSDFEFIICDDGSTDESLAITEKIIGNDNRVVLIRNDKNKGLSYVLNKCLEVSKGEFIARMDADDESYLDRLEKQVRFLNENSNIDLVSCCCDVFDENGIYGERIYKANVSKKDFLFNSPIIHPAIMVRKKALTDVNGYRDIPKTYRVEDYDLFMRMLANNSAMYIIQEKLFKYREDKETNIRRKYKYRINEFRVRLENFKTLGLLPKYFIYVIKPLIVGVIPSKILNFFRN